MTAADVLPRLTDRKREAIVQAAIAEFRESGFSGTSMDRVAAAAGVSKRTVYNHFPSKDELFSAILDQLWNRSHALPELRHDAGRPLRQQLLELIGGKMQLFNDPSFMDLSRVVMAEMLHTPERAKAMAERLSSREEGLPAWIRDAQEAGRLRADADPLYAAHLLMGQLKTHAFWPQLLLGQPPLDAGQQAQVLADAVDMFLGFYARG